MGLKIFMCVGSQVLLALVRSGRQYSLHLKGRRTFFHEKGGSTFLRSVGTLLLGHTMSHSRNRQSSILNTCGSNIQSFRSHYLNRYIIRGPYFERHSLFTDIYIRY